MSSEPASTFAGFVSGGAATTLPSQLFVELLPEIEDEAELRVTLYALYAIGRQRGQLRAVRGSELANETPLARSFMHRGGAAAIRAALDRAAVRGTLLALPLEAGGAPTGDSLYFVHNDAGRRQLLRLRSGALEVPGVRPLTTPVLQTAGRPAEVFEQEIGAITPTIADALRAASERWPEAWIVEAIGMAALRNARSWRYAEAILERWEAEGRDDATTGAAAGGPASSSGTGPDRDHGPYERVIRRS